MSKMNSYLVERENVIKALSKLDRFGIDERGRIVKRSAPYVKLEDVIGTLVNMSDDCVCYYLFECDGMGCEAAMKKGECPSPNYCHATSNPFHAKNFTRVVQADGVVKFVEKNAFAKEE